MSLRLKLLLVALSTLSLPWAGWQFVRQTEALLRQGQEQTLLASASTLARALDALAIEPPAPGTALYVHERKAILRIDGYADDWQPYKPYEQAIGPAAEPGKLRVMLAEDREWLYLFAEVRDATRARVDARTLAVAASDHVDLTLQRGDESRRYRIASAAPGRFEATALERGIALPDRLTGEWQEDGSGYRFELRIARVAAPERIAFAVHDSADATPFEGEPLALLGYSADTGRVLARLAPPHVRVSMVSADGWVVGAGGKLDAQGAPGEQGLFARLVYWLVLASPPDAARTYASSDVDPARLGDATLRPALAGRDATSWRVAPGDAGILLSAAVPLQRDGAVRGALVVEQANPAVPALANRALSSLLGASLLAFGVTAGLLLVFGGMLSLRIRRLRDAAERATRSGGRLAGPLPLVDSPDELGDLARSFGRLLDEVGGYTDYLRTLASKLSHELNTPLAIVKSSLDNLDHHVPVDAARAYLGRARDGAERLGTIVRAMSESSRIERAISGAEAEDVDLRALVAGCADGYRAVAGSREVRLDAPAGIMPLHGAPDLVAQALDKLFDNARSFTPEGGWIRLAVEPAGDDGWFVRMANRGPTLPEAMQDRLFDTLVSVREPQARGAGETPHLGLGLYVVKLVAELHAGRATARNLPAGDGVEFTLHLRGMPRRRIGRGDAHD